MNRKNEYLFFFKEIQKIASHITLFATVRQVQLVAE